MVGANDYNGFRLERISFVNATIFHGRASQQAKSVPV
jgi:hypothetical protein